MASLLPRRTSQAHADFADVRAQWRNPNDILTILMIIGGDIVQCALASLAGSAPYTVAPVAFSFGWVAYAFSAVLAAVGDGQLMPAADCPSVLINANTGSVRSIRSWALGRLVRDYEPPRTEHERGLTVCFLRTSRTHTPGVPTRDWVYYSGVVTIALQLGIAAVPAALNGNWLILILTCGGTALALATTALPQWSAEKWAARRLRPGKREVVCLTRGNGADAVLVVRSDGCGLQLEDLAAARATRAHLTIGAAAVLALLWLVHLLTVEGLQTDAWYSLAVGALGMLQNGVAAGARRTPGALGFHFVREETRVVYGEKVFRALQMAEAVEPRVGLALVPVFLPGGLREEERRWRDGKVEEYARRERERERDGQRGERKGRDAESEDRRGKAGDVGALRWERQCECACDVSAKGCESAREIRKTGECAGQ